jgi:hypothetical protein
MEAARCMWVRAASRWPSSTSNPLRSKSGYGPIMTRQCSFGGRRASASSGTFGAGAPTQRTPIELSNFSNFQFLDFPISEKRFLRENLLAKQISSLMSFRWRACFRSVSAVDLDAGYHGPRGRREVSRILFGCGVASRDRRLMFLSRIRAVRLVLAPTCVRSQASQASGTQHEEARGGLRVAPPQAGEHVVINSDRLGAAAEVTKRAPLLTNAQATYPRAIVLVFSSDRRGASHGGSFLFETRRTSFE